MLEEWVRPGRCSKKVRRLARAGLGREALPLLVTNQKRGGATALVDRYVRRMLIANQIADAIRFFHMDALSSAVPLKVDVDLKATLMAGSLYRMVATPAGARARAGADADAVPQLRGGGGAGCKLSSSGSWSCSASERTTRT